MAPFFSGAEFLKAIQGHDVDIPLHVFAQDRVHANGPGDGRTGIHFMALFAQVVGAGDGAEHDAQYLKY